MSAAELRQAAETLRALCVRADEDYDTENEDRWFRVHDGMTVSTWARFAASHENEAPYIATMHPGVGLALADWLDHEATYNEESSKIGRVVPEHRAKHSARLATLINGGAPY